MEVKTLKFGTLEVAEQDVIHFSQGIPGLPHLKRFVLCDAPDIEPFTFLQSIDSPEISFLLVVPHDVFPGYRFQMTDEARNEVAFAEGHTLAVYAIVTPAPVIADTTVNLLAPVIINAQEMRGHQLIQESGDYAVRHPLISGGYPSPA